MSRTAFDLVRRLLADDAPPFALLRRRTPAVTTITWRC